MRISVLSVVFFLVTLSAHSQNWGEVRGTVSDVDDGTPLPGITVFVESTDHGTATDDEGFYSLSLPSGTYLLRFSGIGFQTHRDSIQVREDQTRILDVALADAVTELGELTVEDYTMYPEAGVIEIDPQDIESMPTPLTDGLQALQVMPGVAARNELSSQYSVRGGGYNENLIFINGFEIHLPFRARQGEQEGLSLFNPQLAQRITFYTGGFPVRYGGKLSSALDVRYRRPDGESLHGQAALGLSDMSFNAGSSVGDGRFSWLVGGRIAQPQRLFGSQELQGQYDPRYEDFQVHLSVDLANGHRLSGLGVLATQDFRLEPSSRHTYFGTIGRGESDLQAHFTEFDGEEAQGYKTHFGGIRIENQLTDNFDIDHGLSYYRTTEAELVDITGTSELAQIDPGSGDVLERLGRGQQVDFADNAVTVSTITGQGRYRLTLDRHAFETGWQLRRLNFDDRIDEYALHRNLRSGNETLVNELQDEAQLSTYQTAFFGEHTADMLPERGRLITTLGVRGQYYDFNGEWTISPRLTARYQLSDATTLTASAGQYIQPPTYRELRGKPETGESILGALNEDLKSQRSIQGVIGAEHFLNSRRMYVRVEAYYRHLTEVISYDIENVRVLYSGENDARGHAYGLDVQLRGELVPGYESWINYSYLVSNERFQAEFRPDNDKRDGLIPRPADQRHTISAFVQDYIPGDDTWLLHLRALFGSGFPYTPPEPGEDVSAGVQTQVPGPRASARLPEYQRVDIGATKVLTVLDHGINAPVTLQLTAELLNLFDMTNTVAYRWDESFNRLPVRLTPRMVNVRARLSF